MIIRIIFCLILLGIASATLDRPVAQAQVQAQQNTIPVSDLGTREQGRSYPLKLTAVNIDCDLAQDFEFEIDNTPWLVTPGGASVPGLGQGQSRSLPAQLDFTYTPPGIYYGHVTSRCTSCGWYIFSACIEHGQDVVLKVTVADPADPTNGANLPQTPNPYARMKSYVPSNIVLNPRLKTSDENLLTREQKHRLKNVRNRVKAAQVRGVAAQKALSAARKKKADCERELARLKAAMDAANRKAGIAAQDAANAQAAANAAAKELADYEKDKAAAQKAIDKADAQARAAMKNLIRVLDQDGGPSGARAQNAKAEVDKFGKEWDDAKAAYKKIVDSNAARKRAADQAKRDADAAKANARQAQADANAATAQYNAKARECNQATAGLKDATKALEDAEANARHAVGIANYEESEAKKIADKARAAAKKRGIKKLKEDIEKQKKRKKKCETEVKEYANYLTRMFKAIRDLTKMDNRKITDADIDVETTAVDMAKEFIRAAAATGVAKIMPTGETAFGALKAGYDIIILGQLENTTGKGLFRGNDILGDNLKDKGYAKTNAEGDKMALDMEKWAEAKGNASFFQSELREKILNCNKIAERIKELEAQQAAAKK